MIPIYEETRENLCAFKKKCKHAPPHLHKSIECVYVFEGSLALGIGQELYQMNRGDFAIIFPELIHHYQVFDKNGAKAYFLLALPSFAGSFFNELQKMCPKNPVIPKEKVHSDVVYAINTLLDEGSDGGIVSRAFFQILLARSMPYFKLVDKEEVCCDNIVYRVVSYISANFRESISLSQMARELGVSKYVLSRVFSGTFHRNFNQYLNETRLEYACALLKYSNAPIIAVAMDSGFDSQRTFNRVFRERFRKTPKDYRQDVKKDSKNE